MESVDYVAKPHALY